MFAIKFYVEKFDALTMNNSFMKQNKYCKFLLGFYHACEQQHLVVYVSSDVFYSIQSDRHGVYMQVWEVVSGAWMVCIGCTCE